MKSENTSSQMWTEVKNNSDTRNSSKMVDPDLPRQLLHAVQQRNGSTTAVTHPSSTEEPLTQSSGIIPGENHSDHNHVKSVQIQEPICKTCHLESTANKDHLLQLQFTNKIGATLHHQRQTRSENILFGRSF
ncbi:hypothetical protein JOB18_019180 [Solea senegalensis]|uniref:Uncharacterized protein n=1 Tax=Solea senegalensis TaxID=28829 RepID=A0AAV6QHX7_SOLSE|nr:uncharacterized protein sb:cb288 isoform X1 [Solea senegalensis]KAG7489736.1 hypothetical protein JOB18_019180 [Solea senegalensis]